MKAKLIFYVASTLMVAFFFQNCGGSYNPGSYSQDASTSGGPSTPTPVASTPPTTTPTATSCTIAAGTTWQDSTGTYTCSLASSMTAAISQTVQLQETTAPNSGSINYYCNSNGTATAVAGTNSCSPIVTAPSITTQPSSVTVNAGQSFTVSVAAQGSGLTYQWSQNGADISGANSSSYTVAVASATDAGSYQVTIMNGGGTAQSNAVTVTVNTVHKWVTMGANVSPPSSASGTYDPTCPGGVIENVASNTTPFIAAGETCTVASAYCMNDLVVTYTGGPYGITGATATWTLLECQ